MLNQLRTNAEARIKEGTAPLTRWSTTGTQALSLLHRLASAPESAGDALKLLHELQVHQVELDLQHEQAEEDRRQVADDLNHYTVLFELAPFAYLTLDPEGLVIAVNRSARSWMAAQSGEEEPWAGRRIEDLLAPECSVAVRAMFAALRKDGGQRTCAVQSRDGSASAHAVATATPGAGPVLMAFDAAGPGQIPGR